MPTDPTGYDPLPELEQIEVATKHLLASVARMTDDDLAASSLLPGWTRGHVCAHVEGNAESLINLLTWARTGVETPAYGPGDAREAAIEAGARLSRSDHLAALQDSAERFADAVRQMPPEAWSAVVAWRGGAERPASTVPWARLRELEIHHVDLGLAYTPAHWTEEFSGHVLGNVAAAFRELDPPPAFDVHAVDTDRRWQLGDAPARVVVSGAQAALLAWLIGRSAGDGLVVEGAEGHGAALPVPPPWL